MNEITIFNFKGSEVRTVLRDGNPWWVAKDVCDVLGHKNPRDAVRRLRPSEKGVANTDTLGGDQAMTVISESGLYKLVMTSRLDSAESFQDWVTGEVLPSIRQTGSYSVVPHAPSPVEQFAAAAQQWMAVLSGETSALKASVEAVTQRVEAIEEAARPERIEAQVDDKLAAFHEAQVAEARNLRGVKAALSHVVETMVEQLCGAKPCDPPPRAWKEKRAKSFRQINHIAKAVGGARDQMDLTGAVEAYNAVRRHGEAMGLLLPPIVKVTEFNQQRLRGLNS